MPRLKGAARWWRPHPILAPLGRLYLTVAAARSRRYDDGRRLPVRAAVPVLSVGNLAAGGSGKTPVVAWLTERLTSAGFAVGILSRGYGRRRNEPLLLRGTAPLPEDPGLTGDEPLLLARETAARVVVISPDRVEGARLATEAGAELLLLDDGFQHRRLHRDLDILLLDARRPFGNGRGLPAGPLREPPEAALRADLVLLTGAPPDLAARNRFLDAPEWPAALRELLATTTQPPAVAALRLTPRTLELPGGGSVDPRWLAGRRVLAVSGIARPERFERTLADLGARIVEHVAWEDHHRFSRREILAVHARAEAAGQALVVTTAKDAVRWPAGVERPAVLRVGITCGAGRAVFDRIETVLEGIQR